MPHTETSRHVAEHAAGMHALPFCPPGGDLVRVGSRRWFLQTGLGRPIPIVTKGGQPIGELL